MESFESILAEDLFPYFLQFCKNRNFKDKELRTWQQKMLFFAHWAILKKFNIALFSNEIRAYDFGAMIIQVFKFQVSGFWTLDNVSKTSDEKIRENIIKTLNLPNKLIDYMFFVWESMGEFTKKQLVILSHDLNSWKNNYDMKKVGKIITNNDMKNDKYEIVEKYLKIK
ncbi:type II toxin-antitoxin system antitoxin SocA domain-containing protein [Mesomycoplasma lagogenitalium]|uniref:DUF4065 domain-containing protein n=1 Tax=Mesomycoplasma lagogenitalium TaxID=171286 RepID=A0ABY8LWM3_9BACT|nr:type II toxin-antitoxin system antitoxin SocA domain-containing protein [Mesomycoplasma lagogenitalium]WGI36522.1 DUF4065 domain-containing protein [Mesomycoplasma lagogenitalium]